MLDELEAYALLDRLGVPHAPSVALDAGDRAAPSPALCLSGRGQGPVGRDRAQDRRRRRRARRRGRRRAARRHPADRADVAAAPAGRARRPRAGAADGRRARRGADRLPRRSRRRPDGDGGGRRRARPRSSATAACGSRRSISPTAREMIAEVRGAQGARRLSRQAARAISTRWRGPSWRCRSLPHDADRRRGRNQSADRAARGRRRRRGRRAGEARRTHSDSGSRLTHASPACRGNSCPTPKPSTRCIPPPARREAHRRLRRRACATTRCPTRRATTRGATCSTPSA